MVSDIHRFPDIGQLFATLPTARICHIYSLNVLWDLSANVVFGIFTSVSLSKGGLWFPFIMVVLLGYR